MSAKKARKKDEELTMIQSAELLGISVNTLHLWRKNKDKKLPLPIVYHAKKKVFLKSELDQWLKNNQPQRGEY